MNILWNRGCPGKCVGRKTVLMIIYWCLLQCLCTSLGLLLAAVAVLLSTLALLYLSDLAGLSAVTELCCRRCSTAQLFTALQPAASQPSQPALPRGTDDPTATQLSQ